MTIVIVKRYNLCIHFFFILTLIDLFCEYMFFIGFFCELNYWVWMLCFLHWHLSNNKYSRVEHTNYFILYGIGPDWCVVWSIECMEGQRNKNMAVLRRHRSNIHTAVKSNTNLLSKAELKSTPSGPRSMTLTKIWSRSITWLFSKQTGNSLKKQQQNKCKVLFIHWSMGLNGLHVEHGDLEIAAFSQLPTTAAISGEN